MYEQAYGSVAEDYIHFVDHLHKATIQRIGKMTTPRDRLRPPPAERFAGSEHLIDLVSEVRSLRNEPHDGKNSHSQITLFHSGSLRIVLFAFEAGGGLPAHHAPGFVVIHTIRGAVSVKTPTETHKLTASQILTLAPEIVHDVRADEEADILVTVSLTSESL